MPKLLLVLTGLWVLMLSGCSSNTKTYLYDLSRGPKLPTYSSSNEANPCMDWINHVLVINARGKLKPIKFLHQDCKDYPVETSVDQHIQNILNNLAKTQKNHQLKKGLLVFIHGGMNDYESSLRRVERDLDAMMKDGYYPVFINWPSAPFDSYGDSMVNYYQGAWDNDSDRYGSPFTFATDLIEIVARAPQSFRKQAYLYITSFCYNEYMQNKLPSFLCSLNKESKLPYLFLENDPCVLKKSAELNGEIPENADYLNGFECLDNTDKSASNFITDQLIKVPLDSLKILTTPIVDPLGNRAWNSMLSRTHFAMREPCKDDTFGIGSCREGVVHQFFSKLQNQVPGIRIAQVSDANPSNEIKLTLIGHSMGTIIASEIVNQFPNLNYENVVFLGAAVSV